MKPRPADIPNVMNEAPLWVENYIAYYTIIESGVSIIISS